jgi:DMSO/TMAO reductase YedYZ molybdopterin-dependent catalytic subunit
MREKLIESKMTWAREGRLLVPAPRERRRLPPGQRLVKDWPVLDLGTQPNLAARDWQLTVGGLVDRPLTVSWADLARLPRFESQSDIHCVTAWSRFDNRWAGVAAATLLRLVQPRPDARFVILRSYDGYATTVPLADFAGDDVLLATHWEGQPLSRAHGGPVRLVLPQLYFWKSPKWLRHVWFTDRDVRGYWEARGYHKRGDPWAQQRYE